jgi:hypothetical protein
LLWLRRAERHIGLFAFGFFGSLSIEPSKLADYPFTYIPLRKRTMVSPAGQKIKISSLDQIHLIALFAWANQFAPLPK